MRETTNDAAAQHKRDCERPAFTATLCEFSGVECTEYLDSEVMVMKSAKDRV